MDTGKLELKKSEVVFIEDKHEYWLGDKQLKGITSTLIKRAFPDSLKGISEEVLLKAAQRGHIIHEELMNIERWGVLPTLPETHHYIEERNKMGLKSIDSEYIVSDNKYYASAIDNVAINEEGEICLVDYKTFYSLDAERKAKTTLQLNIYRMLFEQQNLGLKVSHLYLAWFRDTKEESHHEFIELPFIDIMTIFELIDADIKGDDTYVYNPLPGWITDFESDFLRLSKEKERIEAELDELRQSLYQKMMNEGQMSFKTANMSVNYIEAGESTRFDSDAFRKENAELYNKYQKTSIRKASLRIKLNDK